jgi:hypothetical protein
VALALFLETILRLTYDTMGGVRKSTAWFVVGLHETRTIPPSFPKLPPSLANLLTQRSELVDRFNSPPLEAINLGLPRTR